MEINNRIRLLRKDHLNITQEEFASKIKISRSNLGSIEIGRISVTDRVIEDICVQFNVSEDWLKYGQGEMFVETDKSFIVGLSNQYNLDSFDRAILESYISLSTGDRAIIKKYMKSMLQSLNDETAATIDTSIDEELESYRLELEAEKKGITSSVSGDIEGVRRRARKVN